MKYPTADNIMEIHQSIIEKSGGLSGVKDKGQLEGIVVTNKMTKEELKEILKIILIANTPVETLCAVKIKRPIQSYRPPRKSRSFCLIRGRFFASFSSKCI